MSKVIDDPVRANQLARAIAADISLYHAEQIDEARPRGPDAVLTQLAEALGEGQELYNSRVSPEIAASTIFWDAITEVVLKGQPPNHSSAHLRPRPRRPPRGPRPTRQCPIPPIPGHAPPAATLALCWPSSPSWCWPSSLAACCTSGSGLGQVETLMI